MPARVRARYGLNYAAVQSRGRSLTSIMAFTTEDVVGLLDDGVNSSDDDLGIELDELDSPYFSGNYTHGNTE